MKGLPIASKCRLKGFGVPSRTSPPVTPWVPPTFSVYISQQVLTRIMFSKAGVIEYLRAPFFQDEVRGGTGSKK